MNEIVQEARAWIGTPYVHQSSVQGVGCDCLGLIRGIWRRLHAAEPEAVPAYSFDWGEPQGDERLWQAATRHLNDVSARPPLPGDVLLFRMREGAVAKHLGVLASSGETATFVHAYAGHGVIESPLSAPWARRVVARFAFSER